MLDSLRSVARIILKFEPLVILAIAPALMFPSARLAPALLAIPSLWLVRKLSTGRFIDRTPLDWSLLLLLIMVLVSLYASFDIAFSLPKISGVLLGLAAYYGLISYCKDRRTWTIGVLFFLLAGLGVAILAILGTQWPEKLPLFMDLSIALPPRLLGLPGASQGFNANQVAGSLLWVAPLALSLSAASVSELSFPEDGARRSWSLGLFLPMLLLGLLFSSLIFMSQSRSAWIGLGLVAAIIFAWLMLPREWALPALLFILLAAIAGGSWILLEWAPSPQPYAAAGTGGGIQSLSSLSGRFEVWSRALYGIQDFAFTGMGMNAFRKVVQVLYPFFMISPHTDIAHAHNQFLQAALDLGIPGLIAYIAIHLGAFWMLIRIWRQGNGIPFEQPIMRGLILGMGGGLAANLIYGMLDAVALGAKPGLLWWILLGLIAGLYRLNGGAAQQSTTGGPGVNKGSGE